MAYSRFSPILFKQEEEEEEAVTNERRSCLFCTPTALQIDISLANGMEDESASIMFGETNTLSAECGVRSLFWGSVVHTLSPVTIFRDGSSKDHDSLGGLVG